MDEKKTLLEVGLTEEAAGRVMAVFGQFEVGATIEALRKEGVEVVGRMVTGHCSEDGCREGYFCLSYRRPEDPEDEVFRFGLAFDCCGLLGFDADRYWEKGDRDIEELDW